MSEFQTKLRNQLLRNSGVKVLDETIWDLPIYTYEVSYAPVRRFRLDILMRMILHVIEEMPIRRALAIAELLYVEELFVEDMLQKMLANGLLLQEKEVYKLTPQGKRQLQAGVFEEEQPEAFEQIYYSEFHENFMPTEWEADLKEQPVQTFRHLIQHDPIEATEELLLEGVRLSLAERKEHIGDFVEAVDQLVDFDDGERQWVTCYEYRLLDTQENTTYVRVWNPLLNGWDPGLEAIIEDKEALDW